MKKIIPLSLLCIFVASCTQKGPSEAVEKNKAEREKLASLHIQCAKTYEYEYKFGEVDNESANLIRLDEFDRNGNLIKQSERKDFRNYDKVKSYIYDPENKLMEMIVKDYAGRVEQVTKYKYDGDNNTERIFYDQDGSLTGKAIYQYDKYGNCILIISYDKDGKMEYKTVNTYDSKGRVKEEKKYDKKGNLEFHSKVLKETDNIRERGGFNENNLLEFNIVTCYENDRIKSNEFTYTDGSHYSKFEYKFNQDNLLIEMIKYKVPGEPSTMEKTEYITFK